MKSAKLKEYMVPVEKIEKICNFKILRQKKEESLFKRI